MKNRLIQALRAISPHLHDDGLAGVPTQVLELAGRINPGDYHMMYVLLMKYPNISAEWVIRGKGEMLIDEDPHAILKAENDQLRAELERERQKSRFLESKLNR